VITPPPPQFVERFRSDCETLIGDAPRRLGVAVSGGPDSLGLLLLAAAAWPGRVAAATVDHRLRPESASEARFVARICAGLAVPHVVLEVEVDPARSSLQRAAREARYGALGGWCDALSLPWLATAHHLDDQAETLLMRLLRGSGVGGLAGIRPVGPVAGSESRLVRPLLGWRRSELKRIVVNCGLEPVSDASNTDIAYDRVRIRGQLAETGWINPTPLARSAAALCEAETALAWMAERLWGERVEWDGEGYRLDPAGLPAELVRRLLVRLLGSAGASPRGDEVKRLAACLADGKTATLAGFRCEGGPVWRFVSEAPRGQLKDETKA
jgi:tRNA(Ile)-lysidine synthase